MAVGRLGSSVNAMGDVVAPSGALKVAVNAVPVGSCLPPTPLVGKGTAAWSGPPPVLVERADDVLPRLSVRVTVTWLTGMGLPWAWASRVSTT